ncbi:MAG: hypothetical protein KF781_07480 [Chitinophagaceae bacterium]|nr:hypothetical protein [Chitinophagaceae bacterium]MCW5905595.1 hypothetical protein [Chitinophagaceae bacterium]
MYLRPKEIRELKIEDIIFTEWKLFLSGSIAKDDDTIYKAIPVVFRDKLLKYMQYPPDYYIFSYGGVPLQFWGHLPCLQ